MYNFIVPDLLESQSKLTRRGAVAKAVEQRFDAGVRAHTREYIKKENQAHHCQMGPTYSNTYYSQTMAISCTYCNHLCDKLSVVCLCFLLCVSRFGFVYQFIVFVESFGPFICCL